MNLQEQIKATRKRIKSLKEQSDNSTDYSLKVILYYHLKQERKNLKSLKKELLELNETNNHDRQTKLEPMKSL